MVVLAWVMVGLGAAAQAVTGFGFSLVSAPFLIAAYHAPLAIQMNLVLSVILNVFLVIANHRAVRVGSVFALLGPAALATVAIGLVVKNSEGTAWTIAAGVLCLAGTLVVWSGATFPRLQGPAATVVAGGLSGALNVTTGIGGPPVVLFAVNARWTPEASRADNAAVLPGDQHDRPHHPGVAGPLPPGAGRIPGRRSGGRRRPGGADTGRPGAVGFPGPRRSGVDPGDRSSGLGAELLPKAGRRPRPRR